MEGKMKIRATSPIIFCCLAALFLPADLKSEKSLADIYKSGNVRIVQEMKIDESSMPKDTYFEGYLRVACDDKGFVYICDYKANNIKKFDSSGKFVKTIGRQGQGPGEFAMPYEIAISADRLFVWELGNRRLSVLTLDGEFIKAENIQFSEGQPHKIRPLPNGDVILEREKIYFDDQEKPQDCSIEVYSPSLEQKKIIYAQPVWRNKYRIIESMGTNIIQPFSPLVYWDVSPDGRIVIGYSKNYEIAILGAERGKISSFSHAFDPVKVTDKDKEAFFAGMTFSSGGAVKQGAPDFIIKYTEFPKTKPPFFNLIVDSEGNILVFPHRQNRDEENNNFDAFDPEGKFIANVQIVEGGPFPYGAAIKERTFWAGRADEEGLMKVFKYRISE
jgi:hypothetical protein